MVTVIEHTGGRYDVYATEFGRCYRWVPDRVVVDCGCGEKPALTRSQTACACCGADHTSALLEELAARCREDRLLHPWRYNGDCEGAELRETGLPEIEFELA